MKRTSVINGLLLAVALLGAAGLQSACAGGRGDGTPDTPQVASQDLMGKSTDEVRTLLGEPEEDLRASTGTPRRNATDQEKSAFYETTMDRIWYYPKRTVIFNVLGRVIEVSGR